MQRMIRAAACVSAVVGINSTYRGEPLVELIGHTDCELVVAGGDRGGRIEVLDAEGIDVLGSNADQEGRLDRAERHVGVADPVDVGQQDELACAEPGGDRSRLAGGRSAAALPARTC